MGRSFFDLLMFVGWRMGWLMLLAGFVMWTTEFFAVGW